jgi:hypothetical protein
MKIIFKLDVFWYFHYGSPRFYRPKFKKSPLFKGLPQAGFARCDAGGNANPGGKLPALPLAADEKHDRKPVVVRIAQVPGHGLTKKGSNRRCCEAFLDGAMKIISRLSDDPRPDKPKR